MFTRLQFFKGKIYKLIQSVICMFLMTVCFASLAMTLLFATGARADPIIKNELEDLNILISQFVGGDPNTLIILDLSGSMGLDYGQNQLANWDQETSVQVCEAHRSDRIVLAQCAEKAAGTSVCSSIACDDAECETQDDFDRLLTCVQAEAPTFNMSPIFDRRCGNNDGIFTETASSCNSDTERQYAAAAIESGAGLTQCMTLHCRQDSDPACNQDTEYTNFRNCMNASQAITANKDSACTGGTPDCNGVPGRGTSRLDMALNVFFSFLDADNSLGTKTCDDSSQLFGGSTSISCRNYMDTPFRDVSSIVRDAGTGITSLPITNGPDTKLRDELTDDDAEILGIRFRPMRYSGGGSSGCTGSSTFQIGGTKFEDPSATALRDVWSFYRSGIARGGTPLALSLGFDDSNSSITGGGNVVVNDALGAFRGQLNPTADPAVSCRPQFVIVITDGEDRCSPSPPGIESTNANRRSSIQAVSNLRTYYARNPEGGVEKEILTFVIGIGIINPEGIKALNAMALAGGTHNTGIIAHTDPNGQTVGSVDINTMLPSGSAFQVFKDLGIAKNIDTSPTNATLADCKTPSTASGAHCHFQGQDIFNNEFFDTGSPFTAAEPFKDFAFFANNAEELAAAIQQALQIIQEFSGTSAGVSPATAQSAVQFTSRDRAFVSIITPITGERIWQGRLGLYGFIQDPGNPNAKIIVDKDRQEIFDVNGVLDQDARDFFWEAGKLLAEGDPTARRLFSVDTIPPGDPNPDPGELDITTVDIFTSGSEVVGIRYKGERADFDTNLKPELFGISDADVTDPIPTFCTSACDPATTCSVVTDPACITCVKNCIRDKVVNFMRGDTGIQTVEDPMGLPTTGSQSVNSMGFSCPDPDNPATGSLNTCSVRLGPVFHGSPIIVGSPSTVFFDVGFQNFAREFSNRTGVVYATANDGLIHAFNAGDFVDTTDSTLTDAQKTNPFTGEVETIPFFTAGDGTEFFGFAPPSFHPDAIAPTTKGPETPSGITPPDYRFGDFKTFVVDNQLERSFMDGTPLIADLFIDGYDNGIPDMECNGVGIGSVAVDGDINTCGKEWHTVLLAGYRNGGGAYTALDVTNVDRTQTGFKKFSTGPDYPRHLWTVFDKNFGNTWSEPTIGRVRMLTQDANSNQITVDRWVMFVGGGLDPLDTDPRDTTPAGVNFGNAFYVIDITTGKIIFKLAKDATSAPNGTVFDSRMVCEMSSKVAAFDINADGFIDVVYDGDTCGRLWRIDVSEEIVDNGGNIGETGLRGNANITTPNWTADIAFCATEDFAHCENPSLIPFDPITGISQRQPIFFAPTAVLDDLGRRHVIFVTGNRRHPSNNGDFGKLYNFIDEYRPSFLGGGSPVDTKTEAGPPGGPPIVIIDLVPQGGSANQFTTSGGTNVQGEFIVNFPSNIPTVSGEKGFGSPVVINGVLAFTTFDPDPTLDNPCSGGIGNGRVFALNYLTGQPALFRIPGAQAFIQGSASEQAQAAGLTVAEGMPTPAQLTFGPSGNVVFTLAFTGSAALGGSTFLVWEFARLPANTSTLFWEEIF